MQARRAIVAATICALTALSVPVGWSQGLMVTPADGLLAATLVGSATLSQMLLQGKPADSLWAPDIENVNAVDRLAVFPYAKWADLASDVTQYAALLAPAVFYFFLPLDQAAAAWLVYGEAIALSLSARNIGKFLFSRQRPWIYMVPSTGSVPELWTGNDSFPSGHAVMAFTAAVSTIALCAICLPDSSALAPLAATVAGLASVTSALRVVSGMHFITDVIAGAALGTACGLVVPLLHQASLGTFASGTPRSAVRIPVLRIAL
jgi:undecaprenyl-diphosphatase